MSTHPEQKEEMMVRWTRNTVDTDYLPGLDKSLPLFWVSVSSFMRWGTGSLSFRRIVSYFQRWIPQPLGSLQQKEAVHLTCPIFCAESMLWPQSPLYLVNSWVISGATQLRPQTPHYWVICGGLACCPSQDSLKLKGKSRSFTKTGDKSNWCPRVIGAIPGAHSTHFQ